MTKQMPDTDPLKREGPGETGRLPGTDVGEGGRPAGKPDETFDPPKTGDKHRPIRPRSDEPTNR